MAKTEEQISEAAEQRGETELQRLDRNLDELMAELRVALPGVQVLFAFLLILPFNQRFEQVTEFQRDVYFVTLICTAIASMLLIAPTLQHRLQFRAGRKEQIVVRSHRLAIAGLSVLGVGMCGAVLLVTDFVFSTTAAIVTTSLVLLAFVVAWFVIPLRGR